MVIRLLTELGEQSSLFGNILRCGVELEQIRYLLITHCHFDHAAQSFGNQHVSTHHHFNHTAQSYGDQYFGANFHFNPSTKPDCHFNHASKSDSHATR